MSVSDELERALRTHTVEGYPARAELFGDVTLAGSTRSRQNIFFRVRPEKPMPYDQLASRFRFDTRPLSLAEWTGGEGVPLEMPALRTPSTFFPPEIWETLEAGGKVSWKDVMEMWLRRGGCLDENRNVICYDVDAKTVNIPWDKVETGMLVEFRDAKLGKTGWAGRVVDMEGSTQDNKIVYVELFEPVPFIDAPEAMAPEKILPGFYSGITWKLGYGAAEGWEKVGKAFPPGEWQTDTTRRRPRPNYLFKEPIPLSEVKEFCDRYYPEEPHCLWQGMIMYIVPIKLGPKAPHHQGGTLLPVPEESARSGMYMVWRAEEEE